MGSYLQILAFVIIGIILLRFGYSLIFGRWAALFGGGNAYSRRHKLHKVALAPGDPQACPICSAKLERGELVKTLAFPSITGGKDRLMHIRGCLHCIDGDLGRFCPVCGIPLSINDILIARIFERPERRPHVHVLGCNHCRRHGTL
jgi:hypothetical protein